MAFYNPSIFTSTEFNQSDSFIKLASYMHEKYIQHLISSLTSANSSNNASDLIDHWRHVKNSYFDGCQQEAEQQQRDQQREHNEISQIKQENEMLLKQNQELQVIILALNGRVNFSLSSKIKDSFVENSENEIKRAKIEIESENLENGGLNGGLNEEESVESSKQIEKCVICRKEVDDFSNHKCFDDIENSEDDEVTPNKCQTPQTPNQIPHIPNSQENALENTINTINTQLNTQLHTQLNTQLHQAHLDTSNTQTNNTLTLNSSSSNVPTTRETLETDDSEITNCIPEILNNSCNSDVLSDALPSLLLQLQQNTNQLDENYCRKRAASQIQGDSSGSPNQFIGLTPNGKPRSRTLKTCPVCQKEIYNLPDHMKTHSNERPYACSLCPISFKRKGDLNRHIRNTHRSEPDETKQNSEEKPIFRDSITELASFLQQ